MQSKSSHTRGTEHQSLHLLQSSETQVTYYFIHISTHKYYNFTVDDI